MVGHASSRQAAGLRSPRYLYSLHEVFNKLNSYTTRLVKYQQIKPSLTRGSSAPLALSLSGICLAGVALWQGRRGDRPVRDVLQLSEIF